VSGTLIILVAETKTKAKYVSPWMTNQRHIILENVGKGSSEIEVQECMINT